MLQTQLNAEQASEQQAGSGMRRFTLKWNSRKVPTRNHPLRNEWQECQGVLFSAHDALARVALSNGQHFQAMGELEDLLQRGGDYSIDWIDN